MTRTIEEIKNDLEFEYAPDGEECIEIGCKEPALGIIVFWNFGTEDDFAPYIWYCEKHLLERFG